MFENKIWTDVDTIDDMLRQGTYSFGFIGISETVEVLIGKNIYNDNEGYSLALKIGRFMREYIDALRTEEQVNYSLLATPGEMLSGRFCEIDKKEFYHSVHKKDFYTNSFHVDVDAGLPLLDKIEKEAVFHRLCNGGCITYIEFKSAPLGNIEALSDGIEYAVNKGISYLGFNYPLDICNKCGYSGTFDICDNCGSTNIKHIRRISGYLEDLNFFTKGKTAEEKHRKANA
jgi:ribonucleoside-triphosphate reductase